MLLLAANLSSPVKLQIFMRKRSLFEPRRYLHFDEPISQAASRHLATNPGLVQVHAFFPFIQFLKQTERVTKDSGGNPIRKDPKQRLIAYAAHKDAAIYSWYGHLLGGKYEEKLKSCGLNEIVNAFRPDLGKCNVHFANDAFNYIRGAGPCTALAFDIKKFFNNLDHDYLKAAWSSILGVTRLPPDHYAVFKSLTRYAYVDRDLLYDALGISPYNPRAGGRRRLCTPEEFRGLVRAKGLIQRNTEPKGIPQGSPMSAILSNIYLMQFDEVIASKVAEASGFYRRYCDDILVAAPSEQSDAIESLVMSEIKRVHLTIQSEKTKRHVFQMKDQALFTKEPLQYLGFCFDGQRSLLRPGSVTRFYNKMRAAVKAKGAAKRGYNRRASARGLPPRTLARKNLLRKFSHLGKQNFPSYAYRAAAIMNEPAIQKQLKPHWKKLHDRMEQQDLSPSPEQRP